MVSKRIDTGEVSLTLRLSGVEEGETPPVLVIRALSAAGTILEEAKAGNGGSFRLSAKAMNAARVIAIAAAEEEQGETLEMSPAQLALAAQEHGQLVLSPARWRPLLPFGICVDGKVRKCWYWPWYVQAVNSAAIAALPKSVEIARPLAAATRKAALDPALSVFRPLPLTRCRPVCQGLVEVYERICCCRPIFTLPDLARLVERLRDKLHPIPKPKIPKIPRPWPDPVPFERTGYFTGKTLNEEDFQAEADLAYLERADIAAAQEYVAARPHLLRMICSCGTPSYKGHALIGPDGTFSLCYPGSPFLLYNCHREYAFRVRQVIDGVERVIYDGLAANRWFDAGSDITLTSYDPHAVACPEEDPPVPDGTAFAMLARIGDCEAWHLKTPAPDGAASTATPTDWNDGLAWPAASAVAARGVYRDRNWGGVLKLTWMFTEPLKAAGAVYYRVKVTPADASGNPDGTPRYLDGDIAWRYSEVEAGTPPIIHIRTLPLNDSAEPSFYTIPYRRTALAEQWLPGYHHATLDTRDFADGRHLVTLELYDAAKTLIKPSNAPATDPGTAKAFTYEWWHDTSETGASVPAVTENVPFGALTHMFWWDNRACEAEILQLVNSGTPSSEECQFLDGSGTSTFAAVFDAYHPVPAFMLHWRLHYWRGLSGSATLLDGGDTAVHGGTSASESFATMLGTLPGGAPRGKCTFSLRLRVDTKTYDGTGTLDTLDAWDIASFALDQGS